jgi:hypothetical protein
MTLGLLVVVLVLLGPLAWWRAQTDPSPTPELVDAEHAAGLRHRQARQEIQAIEATTVRLMRAAAASSALERRPAVEARPRPRAVPGPVTGQAVGFVWTPSPVAGSSTSPGRVSFYMPLRP